MCFFLPYMCYILYIFYIGLFDLAIILIYKTGIKLLKVKNALEQTDAGIAEMNHMFWQVFYIADSNIRCVIFLWIGPIKRIILGNRWLLISFFLKCTNSN